MPRFSVRGPMEDGRYHLGYKDPSGTFYLIQEFESFKLACHMAAKMIGDRVRNQRKGDSDGIPSA